jgi:hypothetical protein
MRCPEQPESRYVGDNHEAPLLNDGQRGAAALDRVQAAASRELVVHSCACDHVGLLLEVELTVFFSSSMSDANASASCSWCLFRVSSKKHGFMLGVGLWKWLTSLIHGKNITKNKCHACKKRNLSIKHYSNKKNCMQSSSLNNITSIQKYNSRISVILIYYYALCKGSKWAWWEM